MTFKEKYMMDHPNDDIHTIIFLNCPCYYGYESHHECDPKYEHMSASEACTHCWNREMPGTETTSTTSSSQQLDIHALIDDAIAKKDRQASIFITDTSMSVYVKPLVEEDEKWIPRTIEAIGKLKNVTVGYMCPECRRDSRVATLYCPECGTQLKGVKEKKENG